MIHAVGKPKSIREHNFFQITDKAALDYSVQRLGEWCCGVEVEPGQLKYDQACGVAGSLLTAFEAKSVEQLHDLCDSSEPIDLPADQVLPTCKGPTLLACNALEAVINSSDLDPENRALAAMYQWHLASNPQPIQTLVALDRLLPILLQIGIQRSPVRPFLAMKKLLEPVVKKLT